MISEWNAVIQDGARKGAIKTIKDFCEKNLKGPWCITETKLGWGTHKIYISLKADFDALKSEWPGLKMDRETILWSTKDNADDEKILHEYVPENF